MGGGELKVGGVVELLKLNPMGFSAYSCKIIEIKGGDRIVLSAPSARGKNVTLPSAGNYQLRYLINAGHFKQAAKILKKESPGHSASIIMVLSGEPLPVSFREYAKIECKIVVRFSSSFNESLRGTGELTELSGGGARLRTSSTISIGDTIQFPLELKGCEDMIVLARVIDVSELSEIRLYSLAFTDMHMRLRRQLMTYIESLLK